MQALEEVGESEETKSQGSAYSGADLTGDDFKLDELGEENHLESVSRSSQALLSSSGFSLEDKGWMSSPDSVYSSGSESNITFTEASSPATFNNSTELLEQTQMNEEEANTYKSSTPSSQSNCDDISDSDQQVSAEAVIVSNDDCIQKASVDEPGENTDFKLPARAVVALEVTDDVSQPLVESPELKSGSKEALKEKSEVRSDEASPPTQTHTRVTRG